MLPVAVAEAGYSIASALDRFDFRAAANSLWDVVAEANRFISATRPWELAKAEREGDATATRHLDGVLVVLLDACRATARSDVERSRSLFPKVEYAP